MKDLIQQIIEMDRKARDITNSAQKEKVDSEHEVLKRQEEIRDQLLKRAQRRIMKLEPQERAASDAAWKEKQKQNKEQMDKMNLLYAEKGEEWVSEIVKRALVGGTS